MQKDSYILVTGGAGFIGSCFIKYLNLQGHHNIFVCDDLGRDEKWKNLVGKQFCEFIPTEDLFEFLANEASPKIAAIVHLGACSNTMEVDADYLLHNNYLFTKKLINYALERPTIRFLYASSAATYGDGFGNNFRDSEAEIFSLKPLNMYGYSKQMIDEWLKLTNKLSKVVGLKFFNVFGPNEVHKGKMASAVVKMVKNISEHGEVSLFKSSEPNIYADGEQKRDFIYIKDTVKMIYAFLGSDATGIYNIGSGQAYTWNRLAKAVFTAMNKPLNIKYIDMPSELMGKYQNYSCADMKKCRAAIGDAASCLSLEESVLDYVQNYLLVNKLW